ncbi:hypothetical protein BC332_12987 [Capsicum chinense]|nr:hypothetical protein BC332_12987 [Capsicum chinense]
MRRLWSSLPRSRARNRTNKNQQKFYLVMVELLTTGNLYYVIDGPPKTNSLSQEAKVHVQSTLISRGNSYDPGGTTGRAEYRHEKHGFYAPTGSATESFPIESRGGDEKHNNNNNNKQGKAHGMYFHTLAAADKFGNIYFVRLPQDVSDEI